MRSSVILLIALGAGVAVAVLFLKSHHSAPAPTVVAAVPAAAANEPVPVEATNSVTQAASPVMTPTNVAEAMATAASASVPGAAARQSPAAKVVDALLTAKSAREKHELFQKLVRDGQIDDVIAELKQRAAENPNDPEIPTTLGEAQLNKIRALHDSGADNDDLGILAMQADQNFNAALKIDPQNWEAQFVKASSMYYWPANPERDNQVVQQLSNLIDQQDKSPTQPDFAQTYLLLGNEYQKIGQPDKAMATWMLGVQKFPNNSMLQQKINGQ